MSTDPLTIAAGVAVLVYAYGLGAAAALVWRLYPPPLRYVPAAACLCYYLALIGAKPPALQALLTGHTYPPGDALRTICAACAFGLGLLLLAKKARNK